MGRHFLLQGIFPTQLDACVLISVLDPRFGSHSIINSPKISISHTDGLEIELELNKVVIIISVRVVRTQKPNFKFSFSLSVHGQLSETLLIQLFKIIIYEILTSRLPSKTCKM